MLRAFYLTSEEFSPLCDFIEPDYSAADRKAWRTEIRGLEANIKSEGRKTLADRRAHGTEDKAAGQCQGDLGDSVDSLTTLPSRPSGCRCYPSTLSTTCHHCREGAAPGESRGASSNHGPSTAQRPSTAGVPARHPPTWRRHGSSYPLSPPAPPGASQHEKKYNFRPFLGAAGVSGRRKALCGFRARGLWSAQPQRSGILAVDLVSFPYFMFSCRDECRFRKT